MFAKLFDTPNGQLLVTREFDDSDKDNPYKMQMRGESFKHVGVSVNYSYPTEEQRDEWFEKIAQEDADKVAATLRAAVGGLMK